jgi:hypothetical protein
MGASNRVGIGLSYRPAVGIDSLESIPGLLKRLQIRALKTVTLTVTRSQIRPYIILYLLLSTHGV